MSFSIRASQGVLAGVSGPGWPGGLGGWPQVSRSELLQEGLQGCFAARLQCLCPGVHIQVALPWGCSWSGRVLLYGGFPHQTAFAGFPMGVGETFPSFSEALASQSSFLPSFPWQGSGLHLRLKALPASSCSHTFVPHRRGLPQGGFCMSNPVSEGWTGPSLRPRAERRASQVGSNCAGHG